MTEEEVTLTLIKGTLFSLPEADRVRVLACADKLRAAIAEAGDAGPLALALVGGEFAAAA